MTSNYNRKKNNYFRLYVLKLEHGKYYVGLSHNVEKRFKMHKDGKGAEFTKIYKPISIIKNVSTYATTYANAGPKEDNETIKLMKIFGRENVRGGRYCAVSQAVVDNLLGKELCKSIDASLKAKPLNKNKKVRGYRCIDLSKQHNYQIRCYKNKRHVKAWTQMEIVHLLMNSKKLKLYSGRYDKKSNTIWVNQGISNAYKAVDRQNIN